MLLGFVPLGDLPEHVQEQIREERQQEQREKERQEWERNLCKVSSGHLMFGCMRSSL